VLDLTLNTEMGLHRQYAERFGITPAELEAEPMWPTTRAYTDFLIRTAADGDLSDLASALLPCAWGYAYVGHHLARTGTPDDPRYADWIAMYASDEFGEAVQWLKEQVEKLAEGASAEKRARLTEIFVISSRYEWMFWEMCYNGERWPV
jgi:thiaminase/transcriptional activator TenA